MSELIGAGHGERTEEAMHRNGYMARRWDRGDPAADPRGPNVKLLMSIVWAPPAFARALDGFQP